MNHEYHPSTSHSTQRVSDSMSSGQANQIVYAHQITWKDYLPLVYIFIGIILATYFRARQIGSFDEITIMTNFMGFFFLAFGFFKAISWKNFALIFSSYDIVAKRIKVYAWIYPAIELGLAVMFLFHFKLFTANLITLIVMAVGSIGVYQNLKTEIQCACLGTIIKVPLSNVSLLEDILMGVMALVMLFRL